MSRQEGQTLQDLVDVDRAVPVVDDHRLIEIDPAADGREIGCRQTARQDLAWARPHRDRSGVGPAPAAAVDPALCPSGASFGESSALGERGNIVRAVRHANDDHRICQGPIVDCVGAMKRYTQSGSQPIARRCREREAPYRVESGFDLPDEPGRNHLG